MEKEAVNAQNRRKFEGKIGQIMPYLDRLIFDCGLFENLILFVISQLNLELDICASSWLKYKKFCSQKILPRALKKRGWRTSFSVVMKMESRT
jgi:hypothetical protein